MRLGVPGRRCAYKPQIFVPHFVFHTCVSAEKYHQYTRFRSFTVCCMRRDNSIHKLHLLCNTTPPLLIVSTNPLPGHLPPPTFRTQTQICGGEKALSLFKLEGEVVSGRCKSSLFSAAMSCVIGRRVKTKHAIFWYVHSRVY